MKKVLATLLLSALVLSHGFAEGQAEEEAATLTGPVEIDVWTLFGGGEADAITAIIEDFNASQDLITAVEQRAGEGYYKKLITAYLGDTSPDVAICHLSSLPDYASKGMFMDISTKAPKALLDEIQPNILQGGYYDGKLYAIPLDTHPYVMYYNKDILAENNLDVPETWAEFEAAVMALRDKGLEDVNSYYAKGAGEQLWWGLYNQLGGSVESGSELVLDRATVLKTYEFFQDFRDKGIFRYIKYGDAEAMFLNGVSAFHTNGVWGQYAYNKTEGLNYGVTNIPVFDGAESATWGDSHSWVLPKNDDPQKVLAGLEFIKYVSENSVEWSKAGHFPVNTTVLASDAYKALPHKSEYAHVIDTVTLAPPVKGWAVLKDKFKDVMELFILGDLDAQGATDMLFEEIAAVYE